MRIRARHSAVLFLALSTYAAGCVGGRKRVSPTIAAAARDSAAGDSALRDSASRDSTARRMAARDSVIGSAVADSARRLATADSVTRAFPDSAKGRKTAAKTAPLSKQCVLDFSESPPETRLQYNRVPDGSSNTYIGGGFVGHCQGENNRIRADSAEQYGTAGVVNLFGNVVYEEPKKMRITAPRATYFTREQRLYADGGIVATQLGSGSTFTGPSIEYLRPLAGVRTTSKLIAPGRPTARVIEKDSTGKPGAPVVITANTMQDEGDTLLYAWGMVTIVRNSLTGVSDSASYDKVRERARLIRQARVTNDDPKQPFRLVGDTIDMFNRERTLERVLALHNANATNQDFVMQAERIDLRLVEQKLDRAFASGRGRAKASTKQQELVADSIEIQLPGQRVREVRAIGAAVATGVPDTLKIKSEDRDVLRGDTVIAQFDTVRVPGDTGKQARIREIEAQGNASSLFQAASKQGPTFPPALNYLRAHTIVVSFDTGTVRTVVADSSASGLYLEPVTDSLSDSAAKKSAVPAAGARRRGPATRSRGGRGVSSMALPRLSPVNRPPDVGHSSPRASPVLLLNPLSTQRQ